MTGPLRNPEPADAGAAAAGGADCEDAEPDRASTEEPDPAGTDPAGPDPAGPEAVACRPAGRGEVVARGELVRREPPRIGVELQVRLSTIRGLDDAPADLAGHGSAHPQYARDLLADLGAGQWRFAITGFDGRLLVAGLTPIRPTGYAKRSCRSQGTVELAIPESLLAELLAGDLSTPQGAESTTLAAWADVIADIGRRVDVHSSGVPPPDGTDDPTRRFPSPARHLPRHRAQRAPTFTVVPRIEAKRLRAEVAPESTARSRRPHA